MDDLTLRDLSRVQPYFAAYMHLTGSRDLGAYIRWNNRMWCEFFRQGAIRNDRATRLFYAADFGAWLNRIAFPPVMECL